MNIDAISECDRKSLESLSKLQLSNSFKKVGVAIVILSILGFIVARLTESAEVMVMTTKYGLLFGMLIVSISKDKIEDEFVMSQRLKSYAYGFITAIGISLIVPIILSLAQFFVERPIDIFKGLGDWQILWFLLSLQLFYFEFSKRMNS